MYLVHLADELVNASFSVTKVTTLDVVLELPCSPTTIGVRELEWPQEVGGLFEIGASSDDLMYKILNTENVVFTEVSLNYGIVGKGDALLVYLSVSTLVDEFANRLEVWFTACKDQIQSTGWESRTLTHR